MVVIGIQVISAYAGTALGIVAPRLMREPNEVHRQASEQNATVTAVELVQAAQKVQPLGELAPRQPIKPDTHSPTYGINESI